MLLGHAFGSEGLGTFKGFVEVLQFMFYPAGICIGLIVAWKWEGVGGIVTVGSLTAFHLLRYVSFGNPAFSGVIDGLATPGFLFLVCWYLSRSEVQTVN